MFHPPRDRENQRRESEEMSEELDINDSDTVEAIDKMYENPTTTPPASDWKPEPPCQAMVEVYVKEIRGDNAVVFIGWYYPMEVPLSSIHQMPRKEGE